MPRTRIKICGVRDVETAVAAANSGADAVGLVFVRASPRAVDVKQARAIVSALPPFVQPVALFVDESADYIRNVCGELGVRTVQLHGREDASMAVELSQLRIIKALPFAPASMDDLDAWVNQANLIGVLWDGPQAPPPDGTTDVRARADDTAELTGGHGRTFDWSALAEANPHPSKPLILAGGLAPDNVAQAIRVVRPWAVDVSSGVEASRGVKEPSRIVAFCEAVRQADGVGREERA